MIGSLTPLAPALTLGAASTDAVPCIAVRADTPLPGCSGSVCRPSSTCY